VIFHETKLAGVFLVELERYTDERGFFARAFCVREFRKRGLHSAFVNTNVSFSRARGTLRGMHYQIPPHAEAKLVRCTRGAMFDVIVDLRPESETFEQWIGAELTQEDRRMLYVPEGFAHGFLTLTDHVEVTYQVSAFYAPAAERGFRYDDPAFAIEWPLDVRVVSEKDRRWPPYDAPRDRPDPAPARPPELPGDLPRMT
jgi:dTDP-4-dehydrorhamnose 3,5-epimerase